MIPLCPAYTYFGHRECKKETGKAFPEKSDFIGVLRVFEGAGRKRGLERVGRWKAVNREIHELRENPG
jgi:hypothetical protein